MKLPVSLSVALLALGFVANPVAADEASWVDRIAFKGDIRLRYESIDHLSTDRERMRFRSRFGFTADVQDDIKLIIQLATGGDNPVSTNQSFDDGFSRKDIGLDLAYIDWKINDSLTLNAGKMKNPLFRAGSAPLIWDGDLNPEGFAAKYKQGNWFATGAAFIVEERSSSDDSVLYAAQVGGAFEIADNAKLTAGIGYFGYSDTRGNAPFHDGNPRGNTVDPVTGDYVNEYRNTEVFAELSTRVSDWPLKVFAHYTQNNEVSDNDTALAFGAKLGSAKKQGQYEFGWTFQDLEADAAIGAFTDSDFGGSGTGADGHILKGKYALSDRTFLGLTFIHNSDLQDGLLVDDYNRLQLDLEFKFK